MLFCPTCGNLLLVESVRRCGVALCMRTPRMLMWGESPVLWRALRLLGMQVGTMRFFCQTCPYIHAIAAPVRCDSIPPVRCAVLKVLRCGVVCCVVRCTVCLCGGAVVSDGHKHEAEGKGGR